MSNLPQRLTNTAALPAHFAGVSSLCRSSRFKGSSNDRLTRFCGCVIALRCARPLGLHEGL